MKSPKKQQEKTFSFTLSEHDCNTLFKGLGKLPAEESYNTIKTIEIQIAASMQAAPQPKSEAKTPQKKPVTNK